jgi:hypothetical protein
MTVGDRIAMLYRFPSDRRVVVRGYEGGCDDIAAPDEVRLILNVLGDEWYGTHLAVEQDGEPAALLPDARGFRTERLE